MKQVKSIFYYLAFIAVASVFTQCKTQDSASGTEDTVVPSRILETERSTVCEVFTVENPNLGKISQDFADMNLRRQAGDYGPGQYSAFDYWNKVYDVAPGFSILVYTDGSAIHREMAVKAKEDGNDDLFEEYMDKSDELIELGKQCFPAKADQFGPVEAYNLEIRSPGAYQDILALYKKGLNADADPYSLGAIYRYSSYMEFIGQLDAAEAADLKQKARTYARAKAGLKDYDYILEEFDATDEYYVEAAAEAEAATETEAGGNGDASSAYDQMMSAAKSGNLSAAMSNFKTYIAGIEDVDSKYQTAMYIGGVMYSASDYPKAREAYRVAMNANPASGEPIYYVGLMYLSSGELCGPGTGFDSQRVLWPAFDKLTLAISKTLSADLKADATRTMNEYRQYLPTKAQLSAEGLSEGASYTVPCWINETTTVRSSGS